MLQRIERPILLRNGFTDPDPNLPTNGPSRAPLTTQTEQHEPAFYFIDVRHRIGGRISGNGESPGGQRLFAPA